MSKTAQVNEQPFQHLLLLLEAQGALEQAEELRGVLFGPWSSSLELVGELGRSVIRIRARLPPASARLQAACDACLVEVRKVWPRLR